MTGYVAASYSHSNGYPYNIHQFDNKHDSFQLDQAGFSVAYQPKGRIRRPGGRHRRR